MGTRHLIAVSLNNEYKVAQYGQWDGYPSGQGADILEFLSNCDFEKFKEKLLKTRFIDDEKDKEFIEEYNRNSPKWSNEPDNRSEYQKNWFSTYISRDLGSKVLTNILNSEDSEILLREDLDFAKDSLFCEYAYVVDLDKNVFEVYKGFNQSPVPETERFYFGGSKDKDYYPVKLQATFDLNNLPTYDDFINTLEPEEEEE